MSSSPEDSKINVPLGLSKFDTIVANSTGSLEVEKLLKTKQIKYVESPVMGGPIQAEEGILGAIVGMIIGTILLRFITFL